ncbi:S9 family peptidase [Paenibacillus sp. J2TS4]|uniref:alpha/beta hydrolase family protein n=1 Tax=Paenibacillus sp. J2TS4 TaxID=2807194 RepID=UPI001B0DE471|nr:prolyl oligopeptidase family serine peptidase [Paenibacillus sp. J2TS4]GIP34485.1 xylan esterase [Paenibacillus sp. J2TS4]
MKISDLESFTVGLHDVKDQLKQHVYRRSMKAFAEGDRARDAIQTPRQLEERRAWVRNQFIAALGGLPSHDPPLEPQLTGTVSFDGFRIEKIIFQSRPQVYVTSNLYIPDGLSTPSAAVLFVCGHHSDAKHNPNYQMVCQHLVRAGLIVLAIDPVGQGERFSYYDAAAQAVSIPPGTCEHDYAGKPCWLLGQSIARYFVHDIIRAVDYLGTRPEVDGDRIGITGNSGGGLQAGMAMICEPRLAAAAPATFIMNRRSYLWSGQAQDAEQIWPGLTAQGIDHEDILLAMAPKPVQVLAVQYDFFPIEGTRETVDRVRRFWEMYGHSDKLQLVEDASVHSYTENLAKSAAVFFARHLLGADSSSQGQVDPLEPSRLWCTTSGQVRGDFAQSRTTYDENVDVLSEYKKQRQPLSEASWNKAVSWLREQVYYERKPCDLNPRFVNVGRWNDLDVQSIIWRSQEDLYNHGLLFKSFTAAATLPTPLTIAVWNGGTQCLRPHLTWIRQQCSDGRAILVLDVTGTGALQPHPINQHGIEERFGTIYKLATDLLWLNDSLAAIRIYDILRALELASSLPYIAAENIQWYANGVPGLYVQLAQAIDNRIRTAELIAAPERMENWVNSRYYDVDDVMGVLLPGALQHFDLPDIPGTANG